MSSFDHQFDPPSGSQLGSTIDLTPREIEDAGLFEVLQAPGAALGSWAILSALLDTTTQDFKFLQPLGLSREVKTALSGLFGRFVARAYAARYLGYTHFAHIHSPPMPLAFGGGTVVRLQPHDLPDWAAWNGQSLAILEAKGSHSWSGLDGVLDGAYKQAERVEIQIGGKTAPFKRFAIATRWGFTTNGPDRPMLWVKDPPVSGDGVSEDEVRRLGIGVTHRHYASILNPLGYVELSEALLAMASARTAPAWEQAQQTSREALGRISLRRLDLDGLSIADALVGGFLTRAGPLRPDAVSSADQDTLARLGLRPAFVGIEIDALKAAIDGSASALNTIGARAAADSTAASRPLPRMDGSGTWVFRPDEDDARLLQD